MEPPPHPRLFSQGRYSMGYQKRIMETNQATIVFDLQSVLPVRRAGVLVAQMLLAWSTNV